MAVPSPAPDSQRFRQIQELFLRAQSLPPTEREEFVRRVALDPGIADEVLRLLAGGDARTTDLAAAVRGELGDESEADASGSSAAADHRVQSTATGELMEKLANAPKLDEQRYALEHEIGKGGMGLIVRIHDQHLNRRLAMKVLLERPTPRDDEERRLSNQLLGRFLEEAQVTSQLDHPGVVPVHELGLDQHGKVYFTMRLVKGRTASEVFADAQRGDWTVTRALEVILRVCDTMAYAHDKGVLHRDLKPSNVMVGRFGEVYVMDWGLAKVLGQPDRHDLRIKKDESTGISRIDSARKRDAEEDMGSSVVSMDGQQLGTPSYMSPEQARSEALDQRADVYSIGAMMYELLTGRAPYTAPGAKPSPYRILNEVIDGPPKRIEAIQKGVPPELVAIVDKAMARSRERRYASFLELAADVRAYIAQRVVKAYRTGAWVEMKLWVRRNKPLAASLVAAVLILVAGVAATMVYAGKETKAKQDAVREQHRAEQAEQLATARATALEAENEKNRIFAEVALLAEARRTEEDLYPAYPDKVPAMKAWLKDLGKPLAARLPGWEEELAKLRGKAKPLSDELQQAAREAHARWPELQRRRSELEKESREAQRAELKEQIATLENEIAVAGYQFEDPKDAYLHRTLTRLVRELGEFTKSDRLPGVRARLAEAETVQQQTIDAHRAAWDAAIAAINASDGISASKLYQGFELTPQLGLVPVGMDKDSLLWEFVHLASGTPGKEIPERDPATGRLVPTGDMGIVFVLLPGGTLPPSTPVVEMDEGEKRRLTVRLDAFFLGKYEITQGQWLRITGSNPSSSKDENNLSLPVEQTNWFDGEEVLRHHGFVLASELQWEYGIRAGTTTRWWTGDDEQGIEAKENIGNGQLLAVGSKSPNGFGLCDMGGNLWEWCFDNRSGYGTERAGDGRRPASRDGSADRVVRGGLFDFVPGHARSGHRGRNPPTHRSYVLGLRAARTSRP